MARSGTAGTVVSGGRKPQMRAQRADEWTEAKRTRFFGELAVTCNVTASARAAGMSQTAAYKLRARSPSFRAGWAKALSEGYARLELMLLERAMNGTVKTVERPDGSVAKTHEFPNHIALQLLRMHKDSVEENEREYDPAELDEVRRRIGRKLEALRKRQEAKEAAGE